jgi:hypothetical protein
MIPCLFALRPLIRYQVKSLYASLRSITDLLWTKESLRRSNPLRRSVRTLLSGPK